MVRELKREDLTYIKQTPAQLFGPNDSLASIEAAIFGRKDSLYLIYETTEKKGYIGMHVDLESAEIATLFVHPNHRRQGIGEALLKEAIHILKTRHIKHVLLDVSIHNHAALHLYEKMGFIAIHTRLNYYPNGDDARVLKKELR